MLKNILITSGGTSEPIDRIRSITNTSTGTLGSLIAKAFSAADSTENIYYIHGKNAILPDCGKLVPVPVCSTDDLLRAVRSVCEECRPDAVIHCMAVSDFRVRSVISSEILALSEGFDSTESIGNYFDSRNLLSEYNKLPSSVGDPVILLEKTPKILPLFRELLPESKIVGFKLLDGVPHDELIGTAPRLLIKSGCDYVLANDYRTVEAGDHQGYLVDKNKNEMHFSGKQAIAEGIAAILSGGNL